MKLKNKVAIVTGAAQGIGKGIALKFAALGAHVVMVDIDQQAGQASSAEIDNSEFIACDIGDKAAVDQLVNQVFITHGRIDVVVNNAGILRTGDVLDISEAEFDEVLRINLKGAFLLSQAVARMMVEGDGGSIINMSSINAWLTIPDILPYNVSKGGLNQLTRVMAVALAQRGVRVNAIAPGSILTEMLQQIMTDEKARETVLSRTPMGRCGTVEEIANVAAFLASDESSYVTGEVIVADGGRMGLNYTVAVPDTDD